NGSQHNTDIHGQTGLNPTDANNIIYSHLSTLPKSKQNNAKINTMLKGLSKMSELGILQDVDMTVPGLNIPKSLQHINYECTGYDKRIKGSVNFPTTAPCIIRCQAKFMGRIDHIKLSKLSQGMTQQPNNEPSVVGSFQVHINYSTN